MAAEADDADSESVDSLLAAVARIPVPAQSWTPPTELDEYKLIRPLGRGGMGSVWLAEDSLLERLVAIKFIAHAEPDPHTRERFAIEARAAARLSHQNVVTVHRFGEVSGRPYLVSEYIRGDSLDKVEKPMPWKRSLELGIALARGLAAAHRHGIVHRDIKPANAILAADGEVKLVDFGLAKIGGMPEVRVAAGSVDDIGTAATELTRPGMIAGTPRYMAPEVRGGTPADRRSDVYQVGCILYELVIGRAPVLDAKDGVNIPLRVEDAKFAAIVDRCLRRDPEARFATGDELREALERLAAPLIGGALPEGNPYRGLVAFDAEHRALFFGRGAEIRAVIERLRADPFVLVTGDSGVGKSSLCRAGVLPHVVDGALGDGRTWTAVQLVPGQHPYAALLAALELDETTTELPRALRRKLGATRGLVVFVDQLEELTTLADRDEAAATSQALRQLAAGIPGVRLLATVRSDFLTRVAEPFGADVTRALYLVPPLSADGAREAIVGPAHAKGAKFESDTLVDTLVAAVADSHGSRAIELPLLAFTLAQLWDARDQKTQTITAGSLEAIGGVHSALARHADGVLAALMPTQRETARKLLLRLVTPERTRARRSTEQLAAFDRSVLDALVRGRLVVARGDAFELAHERLIDGWPTLAGWLSENVEAVAAHARLAAAAADWERLERARERLWGERQLIDLDKLGDDLTSSERAFAETSRRALRRRRIARIGLAIAVPAVLAIAYGGARLVSHLENARRISDKVDEAMPVLTHARAFAQAAEQARREAFAAFDANDGTRAQTAWNRALEQSAATRKAYGEASRLVEAAFLFDTTRDDIRHSLAELTFERLRIAEREFRNSERDELEARLSLYDRGEYAAKLRAPAHLRVAIPGAQITLLGNEREVPVGDVPPGSYVLVARAEGRATVTLPIMLRTGEEQSLVFELPVASSIPPDFVYIPPGSFLYGSNDDEGVRMWFTTVPMHVATTGAFLIARHETTWAEWLEFLDDLDAADRIKHTPRLDVTLSVQNPSVIGLAHGTAGWELTFAPMTTRYTARAGQKIVYRDRAQRREQDWLKMPVSGILTASAVAYTTWLDHTKRVPGARLCSEREWERAARGVDGRAYPHGSSLAPDDANIDITYGQHEGGFGMDEVGSHPASSSPFGLLDMAGNVWEMTHADPGTDYVMRGGGFFNDAKSANLANRGPIPEDYVHLHLGLRVCASAR